MKMIYKYPIAVADEVAIKMPLGAVVLDVQVQRDDLCLWALVDPDEDIEVRRFRVFGTGNVVDRHGAYVGTVQMRSSALVWHIFEAAK